MGAALSQLVRQAESVEHACGGLLVLTQNTPASALFAPLLDAVLEHRQRPGAEGGAQGADGSDDAPWVAEIVAAWALPLGWLVCRCDNLEGGQRALLDALERLACKRVDVLKELSPALKGLWEANVLAGEAVAAYVGSDAGADGKRRRARDFAKPFADWLATAKVVEEEAAAAATEEIA